MIKSKNKQPLVILLVLSISLLLAGCFSTGTGDQEVANNQESKLAVKLLSKQDVLPKDPSKAKINLEVFNDSGKKVKDLKVDATKEVVNLNLKKGTYSIKATLLNKVDSKAGDYSFDVGIASGGVNNIVIETQSKTIKIELKSSLNEGNTNASSVGTSGSAPPLDSVYVCYVESTKGGEENIDRGQYSTDKDHGGTNMYVHTVDKGIGYSYYAEMNAEELTMVQEWALDFNGDNIIDGYERKWDASGHESGEFYYENTSENYPWNTETVTLQIQ